MQELTHQLRHIDVELMTFSKKMRQNEAHEALSIRHQHQLERQSQHPLALDRTPSMVFANQIHRARYRNRHKNVLWLLRFHDRPRFI